MLYFGYDPSYKKFGLSIINDRDKILIFKEFTSEIDKKSTRSIYETTPILVNEVIELIEAFINLFNMKDIESYSGIEVTRAMTGWMTSELYALDYECFRRLSQIKNMNINLYANSFLSKSLLGHKSSDKEATINLVEDSILPIFTKHNYEIKKLNTVKTHYKKDENNKWINRETITDGEADSLMYALRQLILYSSDKDLVKDILEVLPKLSDSKEML